MPALSAGHRMVVSLAEYRIELSTPQPLFVMMLGSCRVMSERCCPLNGARSEAAEPGRERPEGLGRL